MNIFRQRLAAVTNSASSVLNNLGRMLSFAWSTDKFLTTGYFGLAGVGSFFPIITSFIYKLLIDSLVSSQNIATTIPVILIALLGARYVLGITSDFVSWGLKSVYFDFLFRYKIQNALNYSFFSKVSSLDVAHLENPETEDLITKAQDTFTWRPPDFLRQFSYLFGNFVGFVSSFFLLIPYGFFIPMVVTFVTLPRLYLRAKFGKLEWSIYGSGAPEVRRLWYLRWLLSRKEAIIESRIFQSHKELLKRFKSIQNYLYEINKGPVRKFLDVAVMPQLLEISVIFVFAYLKLPAVLSGQISIGDFTFFISLLDRISGSAADMILNFGEMYENNLYVNHFFEVMNLPKLIKEEARPTRVTDQNTPPKIEFRNVSFTYPGNKEKVLKGVSFAIEPGENFAIVGKNGAGKTTLVKLLCRFYDVDSGEILVNGTNLKKLKLSDWYRYIGTLFQEFMHYDFTARENIMLGNTDIRDEKKMRVAAKMSGADQFIDKLPKKYDQVLGRQFEGGTELSQGQWQKLAVARAFYESAPILILDEPTSAIDAEAEYEIFHNLTRFYKDKTLFLISHRFSTVRNADKIVVLDGGRIVEEGNHERLLKQKGLYAKMFNTQAIGYQ